MGFFDFMKMGWEWLKDAIRKLWDKFRAFFAKVADWSNTVYGLIRKFVQDKSRGAANWVKNKLYVVFTPKKEVGDLIGDKIKEAKKKGDIGVATFPNPVVPEHQTSTSDFDINLVEADDEYNTKNVYSVSPDKITDDLRSRAAEHSVVEINFAS